MFSGVCKEKAQSLKRGLREGLMQKWFMGEQKKNSLLECKVIKSYYKKTEEEISLLKTNKEDHEKVGFYFKCPKLVNWIKNEIRMTFGYKH